MMFALGNADASGEVVDILAQSLSLQETAVPLKVRVCVCRLLPSGQGDQLWWSLHPNCESDTLMAWKHVRCCEGIPSGVKQEPHGMWSFEEPAVLNLVEPAQQHSSMRFWNKCRNSVQQHYTNSDHVQC